jgi:hypothetical protein
MTAALAAILENVEPLTDTEFETSVKSPVIAFLAVYRMPISPLSEVGVARA